MEQFKRNIFLPDGRKLAYAESGPEYGWPILMMHGQANSRLNLLSFYANHKRPSDLALRIICPDRPGRGLSSFDKAHDFQRYAKDMEYLVDQLGIVEFSMLGYNTGAVYALKLAEYFGGRIDRLFLVSPWLPGKLPGNRPLTKLLTGFRWFHSMNAQALFKGNDNPAMALRWRLKWASKEEKELMRSEKLLDYFEADMRESFGQQYLTCLKENLLIAGVRQFEAKKLSLPVRIYDGQQDKAAVPRVVDQLVQDLPDAEYEVFPGLGHFILYFLSDQFMEILQP